MKIQEEINQYWSKRAKEFSDMRRLDLQSDRRQIWTDVIRECLPDKQEIRALDLGTGAGFFAFLLTDLGCNVTGIDYSQDMINCAVENAKEQGYSDIEFLQMDAQNLLFADAQFDFIVTRNVTWTLPDAAKAYGEMCRVLAPGGRLANFDANYGAAFRKQEPFPDLLKEVDKKESPYLHPATSLKMIRERNALSDRLYVSDLRRPQWDVDILLEYGMRKIVLDTEIADRVYQGICLTAADGKGTVSHQEKTPFFMVLATKPQEIEG